MEILLIEFIMSFCYGISKSLTKEVTDLVVISLNMFFTKLSIYEKIKENT